MLASGARSLQVEEVPGPRPELDEQSVAEVVARPLVRHTGRAIDERARRAPQVGPRCSDVAGRGCIAQVHDDEPTVLPVPRPRHEVLEAVVAVPTGPLAQLPATVPE